MPPRNLIIITPHDLGDFLGCYGTPVPTPNIDGLARDGVIFQQHFSTGTVCSPSRGSITTGCYPHTHGLMGLVHRGWELDTQRCPPIAQQLARVGYHTHLFGFQHEHWDPHRLGYRELTLGPSRQVEAVSQDLVTWLREVARHKQPFFAAMGFSEVHRIGLRPSGFKREIYEPADPNEVLVPPWLPDIPAIRQDLANFYGAIKHMDRCMGDVLSALEESGLAENTLVVFTSDHGASFIHGKATLYDGGTKVPWLMRLPGVIPEGTQIDLVTSHVDILPTILELLGIPVPAHVQGQSMRDLLMGDMTEGRNYVFAEKNYTNYYDPSRMVRSRQFKYIRKGLRTCVFDFQIPEIELSPWDFRRTPEILSFYSAQRCTEELYDLAEDPGELHNLVNDPAYADILDKMRRILDQHLEVTDDPFRNIQNGLLMPETTYEAVIAQRLGKRRE